MCPRSDRVVVEVRVVIDKMKLWINNEPQISDLIRLNGYVDAHLCAGNDQQHTEGIPALMWCWRMQTGES